MSIFSQHALIINAKLLLSILVLFFLPSLMFVMLNQSSLAVGLIFSFLLILLINFRYAIKLRVKTSTVYLAICLFAYLSTPLFIFVYESGIVKPLLSLVVLVLIACAFVLGKVISQTSYTSLYNTAFIVWVGLLVLGWLSILLPVDILGYAHLEKPVFPFKEQSHFALAFGGISLGCVSTSNKRRAVFVTFNVIVLALAFPSLTLFLFVFLSLAVLLVIHSNKFLLLLFVFSSPLVLFLVMDLLLSISYFSERLVFEGSNNLTVLVFLQGWAIAHKSLVLTDGAGIGFQMLGLKSEYFPAISHEIFQITGKYFNIYDGGFLAAKVVSELGLIGVFISITYAIFAIRLMLSTFIISKNVCVCKPRRDIEAKLILLNSLLFGFLVEYFFRGYGYFSPTLLLFFSVLFARRELRKKLYK